MPINKRFSIYTKENVRNNENDHYGAYEIANNSNEILYIGEGHIRIRLLKHFPNSNEPVVGASKYRCEYTGSKKTCVQRQNALLNEYKRNHNHNLPPFNTKSTN